ncbi:p21-activated protein kinase-interacting protein 1-like [Porphyridium purpureum]|uniref:p21-activated protein kinase-interacting protein 1-like n=1 Tax=Porphyridium purpureum TaxID=35688 RepID=A0A5J4Z418_PORPP|nr:p21-activated protein kinase-interacting protein 1-like [Porphyridium purpureum]|eukprot:POR1396..scf295_1
MSDGTDAHSAPRNEDDTSTKNAVSVIVGTYGAELAGARLDLSNTRLVPTFGYAAHRAAVRALDSHGHLLASGSNDESIKVYDLRVWREIAEVSTEGATVNALSFSAAEECLLSGGSDGIVSLWNSGGEEDFALLRTRKATTAPILELAAHPFLPAYAALSSSDELVLSSLAFRKVARVRLQAARGLALAWQPSGEAVAFSASKSIAGANVRSASGSGSARIDALHQVRLVSAQAASEDAHASAVLPHESRVTTLCFVDNQTLLTGSDAAEVLLWDLRTSSKQAGAIANHASRVRGLAVLPSGAAIGSEAGASHLVVSVDSAAELYITDLRSPGEPMVKFSFGQGLRATCMQIACVGSPPVRPGSRSKRGGIPSRAARQTGNKPQNLEHEHRSGDISTQAKKRKSHRSATKESKP